MKRLQTKLSDQSETVRTDSKPLAEEMPSAEQPVPTTMKALQRSIARLMVRIRSAVLGQLMVWATKSVTAGLVDLRFSGQENIDEYIRQGRPVIFAGWHGHNFLTMCAYYAKVRNLRKGTIIVPESSNGLVMEYFGRRAGLHVTKVKSELGASQWARATVSMIKLVRGGYCALLSPDGPDGPAYTVKPGIAVISHQTKAVIIPASAAVKRGIKLRKRWDEHLVPMPFSEAVILFGDPIDTDPPDGVRPSAEELQKRIEAALTEGAIRARQLYREDRANEGGAR